MTTISNPEQPSKLPPFEDMLASVFKVVHVCKKIDLVKLSPLL